MSRDSYITNTDVFMNIVSQQLLDIRESPIQMYLFETALHRKDDNSEDEWFCLINCEDKEVEKDLKKYLLSGQKDVKDDKKHIIYSETSQIITDSRYNRTGPREVETAWIFVAEEEKYSYKIISQVFMWALKDELTDLLQLENIIDRIVENNEIDEDWILKEDCLKDKIISKYCSKLLSKDKLIDRYVEVALEESKLPKSEELLALSAMRYETRESVTRLYFGNKKKTKLELEFHKEMLDREILEFKPENYRVIRKLMELAGNGYGLMIDITKEKKVYGILNIKKRRIPKSYIGIEGYLRWSMNIGEEKIFEYSNGVYSLQKVKEESEIDKKFEELKKYLLEQKWGSDEEVKYIVECLRKIQKCATHGASIVFLEEELVEEKVKALSNHSKAYWIHDIDLCDAIKISGFTAIDGAIIADLKCKCKGIGVILDGKSLQPGNAGRGARYNSVTNYVRVIAEEKKDAKCFAAVFSEDKNIDFACIDKSEVEKIRII